MSRARRSRNNPFSTPVIRKGFDTKSFQDIYHVVLASSWIEFFTAISALYIVMNGFYAMLYFLGDNAILNADPESYWDAFVFSFQTSTTIGYGQMLPATDYADLVVIFDTLSSLVFVAITTGLAFAKFSLPTARVLFVNKVVIHMFEGKKTLMFRVANARDSHIADTSVEAVVVIDQISEEGVSMARIFDLKLVRSKSPMFFMSWTVMHVIDETSPLYRMTPDEFEQRNVRIVISLTGIDDWTSQIIHVNHVYRHDQIVYNKKYADILTPHADGSITMDYDHFNKLEDIEHTTV